MCTVLLRLRDDAQWPVQLAFVRDEDRSRPTDPPGAWWSHLPHVVGGRDARAGGTWLAVDARADAPAIALLTDRLEPDASLPDPAQSPTRGSLPLLVLEHGADFDVERHLPAGIERYQPFNLVRIAPGPRRADVVGRIWSWDGSNLVAEPLELGDHVVASRSPALDGEPRRRMVLLDQLARVEVDPIDPVAPTQDAWGDWPRLLDSRQVGPDDLGHVAIHSVRQRPGFGTVGASLVALSSSGEVRYDANHTTSIDPLAWTPVRIAHAGGRPLAR
jgi:hypothetical protein